jgi:hypothetical protein
MKQYSYTYIPHVGRMACSKPQCLYKGDLYLYLAGVIKEVFGNMRMHGREYFKIKQICSRSNFPPSSQTALRNEHADCQSTPIHNVSTDNAGYIHRMGEWCSFR